MSSKVCKLYIQQLLPALGRGVGMFISFECDLSDDAMRTLQSIATRFLMIYNVLIDCL